MKNSISSILILLISLAICSGCKIEKKASEPVATSNELSRSEKQVAVAPAKLDLNKETLPPNHPFALCASCHGVDAEGNQKLLSPRLSGQNTAYIEHQILSFKKGWRGKSPENPQGIIMAEIAKNLSDDDLSAIKNYLKNVSSEKKSPRLYANTLRGERLYKTNGCSYCHGDNAEGDPVNKVPRLNHQHGWYLLKQLKNFKNGVRGTHQDDAMGTTMVFYAKILKDEQSMHDIVSWISSLSAQQ